MKTKKTIGCFLALALLLCMVQIPVLATSSPTLTISNVTSYPGRTFEVEIDISNNPGIASLGFYINYDSNAMSLIDVECGDVFQPSELYEGNINSIPYSVLFISNYYDRYENGNLLTLTFELTESAEKGENYNISVSSLEACNISEQYFSLSAVSGSVHVPDYTPGDVTGDGILNGKDLLRLAKYFAGWNVEIHESASDVTGDGNVNRQDNLRLAKYFAGWDVTLG